MDVAFSNRVIARNNMGRFIADCEGAATRTVEKAITQGEALSKTMAPTGTKHDFRTVTLREGMFKEMLGRTSGRWGCAARHALAIELGAGPHPISGRVKFFWDNEGRWWTPGDNVINHPGNDAQPFLRPAYQEIARRLPSIAAEEYPG